MSVELRSVVAGFPGREVLHEVDLAVGPAELVTVFGPSGGGKTTLLRVIAGLHPVSSGQVLADGQDVTRVPVERRHIGLVPQEGALFPHRTVAGNIGYGLRAGPGRAERIRGLLELIAMPGSEAALPHELSGGQRQRVALARALAPSPRVLLLDEPFSSLDGPLRSQLRADTAGILRKAATAAVLVTHDLDEALSLSDRIAVLEEGRILAVGTPRQLHTRPPNRRVAELLGPGRLVPAERNGHGVRTALGVHEPSGPVPAGRLLALLRPDQLRLERTPDGSAAVRYVEFLGDHQIVHLLVESLGPLAVRAQPGEEWRSGDRGRIQVTAQVHVIAERPES